MDIGEKFDKSTFCKSNCNSRGAGFVLFLFSCSFLAWPINFCMKSISCCWSDISVFVLVSCLYTINSSLGLEINIPLLLSLISVLTWLVMGCRVGLQSQSRAGPAGTRAAPA